MVTTPPPRLPLALALVLVFAPFAADCQTFDAPPEVSIVGLTNGVLNDPTAPLQLSFTKPINLATLTFRISTDVVDNEGNVSMPNDLPIVSEKVLFQHTPGGDQVGTSSLSADRMTLTVTLATPLPIGPELELIVSPGLSDDKGTDTRVDRRLAFNYEVHCSGSSSAGAFPSGAYFFLIDVTEPLGVAINLLADLVVDPNTGAFVGQFTHAARNKSLSHCPPGLSCPSSDVCRTLPAPGCVAPSQGANSADEYPDYVPDVGTPTAYSFTTTGCVALQPDGTYSFSTTPVDADVPLPPVTIQSVVLNASFTPNSDSPPTLNGTGSMTATQVLLLQSPAGTGMGTFTAVSIPPALTPAGLPAPPDTAVDGGM